MKDLTYLASNLAYLLNIVQIILQISPTINTKFNENDNYSRKFTKKMQSYSSEIGQFFVKINHTHPTPPT